MKKFVVIILKNNTKLLLNLILLIKLTIFEIIDN